MDKVRVTPIQTWRVETPNGISNRDDVARKKTNESQVRNINTEHKSPQITPPAVSKLERKRMRISESAIAA